MAKATRNKHRLTDRERLIFDLLGINRKEKKSRKNTKAKIKKARISSYLKKAKRSSKQAVAITPTTVSKDSIVERPNPKVMAIPETVAPIASDKHNSTETNVQSVSDSKSIRKRVSDDDFIKAHAEGLNRNEMATKLKVSPVTASNRCKKLKLALPDGRSAKRNGNSDTHIPKLHEKSATSVDVIQLEQNGSNGNGTEANAVVKPVARRTLTEDLQLHHRASLLHIGHERITLATVKQILIQNPPNPEKAIESFQVQFEDAKSRYGLLSRTLEYVLLRHPEDSDTIFKQIQEKSKELAKSYPNSLPYNIERIVSLGAKDPESMLIGFEENSVRFRAIYPLVPRSRVEAIILENIENPIRDLHTSMQSASRETSLRRSFRT